MMRIQTGVREKIIFVDDDDDDDDYHGDDDDDDFDEWKFQQVVTGWSGQWQWQLVVGVKIVPRGILLADTVGQRGSPVWVYAE